MNRKTVRHLLTRQLNTRIAELRDDRLPRAVRVHHYDREELLMDPDPTEARTVETVGGGLAGGFLLCGIPLLGDPTLEQGSVAFDWEGDPTPAEGAGRG